MHSATASLLLTKLNTGSRFFMRSELKDCDEESSLDAWDEIKDLLAAGFIRKAGESRYEILVDLHTLRGHILAEARPAQDEGVTFKRFRLNTYEIERSVWRLKRVGTASYARDRTAATQGKGSRRRKNGKSREDIESMIDDCVNEMTAMVAGKETTDTAQEGTSKVVEDEDLEKDADWEELLSRRAHVEKLRAKLARLAEPENDEEKEETVCDDDADSSFWMDDDEDDDEENEDDTSGSSSGVGRSYEEMRNALLDLLTDEDTESQLAVSVLKLCAADGYVSPWSISKNLNITVEKADYICFQLYLADFIKKDSTTDDRYVLDVRESLFYVCCNEVKERKKTLSHLSFVLQNIGEQRQKKEQQERALQHKYENDSRFREAVCAKLKELICTDQKMTRVKAITKAEGCLHVAGELGNEEQTDIYRGVLYALNGMSDYRFNRLKGRQGN